MRLSTSLVSLLALAAAPAFATTWKIDPAHSFANFKVKHLMVTNVRGQIAGVNGTVDLDDKDISKSKVVATLDAATVNTNNPDRDKHLRSPDFFNVDKCKEIKFTSTSVTGKAGALKVKGPLTLNCVTKDVEMAIEGPTDAVKGMKGEMHRGLTATTTINRKDFNVSWNKNLDGGGVLVGDNVDISIDIEMTNDGKPAH